MGDDKAPLGLTHEGIARREVLIGALATAVAMSSGGPARAQQWPTRTLRIVVPYTPGGGADTLARMVQNGLGDSLGQSVIVENRPGGSGIPGTEFVIRSSDSHTIGLIVSVHASTVAMKVPLPYDPLADITPLTMVGQIPLVLALHPSVKATNVDELVEYARLNPGKVFAATSGAGTGGHFAIELFNLEKKIKIETVHYKGAAPAAQDLIGGRVQMQFATLSSVWQHVEAGRLRALAISTATRSPLHPDLPTFAEVAKIPGFNIVEWYALIAPPSMPRDIADRLQKALVSVIDAQDFRNRCNKVGIEAKSTTMDGLRQSIGDDIKRLSDIASRAEMKME